MAFFLYSDTLQNCCNGAIPAGTLQVTENIQRHDGTLRLCDLVNVRETPVNGDRFIVMRAGTARTPYMINRR